MENLVNMKALKNIYAGKKVFVTGHTGFKGAWLTTTLHLAGAVVKGFALPPQYPNGLFDLIQPLQPIQSVIGDIRDKALLQKEIENFQPDYIFHLAAQPLVRRSYQIPAETFEVNVAGTANLLEAVSSLQNQCTVVVVTTDKVYQNKEADILYKEDDALGGYDPYSASKACTELVASSFRDSFFNVKSHQQHKKALATARAGNVIGGGDWSVDRLIPDIVQHLQNEEEISVRNPTAVRPWQHVLEPIAGYLKLAALLNSDPAKFSGAYNFGPLPTDHLQVKDFVETAINIWGGGSWKDTTDTTAPHEAGLLKLDISLAKSSLGWVPKLNATQAIEWTIDWYKKPVAQQAGFSFQQIEKYFAL